MRNSAPSSAEIPGGLHVLLVEDEMMVAILVEDMLKSCGCAVAKASRVDQALKLIASAAIDIALLDINVAGLPVYPVAQELDRRRIPFAFVTGFSTAGVRADYRDRPILAKPFSSAGLRQLLATVGAQRGVA